MRTATRGAFVLTVALGLASDFDRDVHDAAAQLASIGARDSLEEARCLLLLRLRDYGHDPLLIRTAILFLVALDGDEAPPSGPA